MPGPDDYVLKNGKWLPNSSKNQNRKLPTMDSVRFSAGNLIMAGSPVYQYVRSTSKYF